MTRQHPPVVLSIAGSDPSGGAGIQADLKTFSALGGYGCAAITALTAQNTLGVSGVHVPPAGFLKAQLDALAQDVPPDAVKIGMLANAEIAGVVSRFLTRVRPPVVVLDPVMVATSGDRLLDQAAVDAVRSLCAQADLITPNLPEAAVLLDCSPAQDPEQMAGQAQRLLAEVGARRVLLKGGHLQGDQLVDVYAEPGLQENFRRPRIDTPNTHGTGCTLSSAVTVLRALRGEWLGAVGESLDWLAQAIAAGEHLDVGKGHGPVHHFWEHWHYS